MTPNSAAAMSTSWCACTTTTVARTGSYIHIEIQGRCDSGFEKRMFVYNYRVFDRYDRPVGSLALLADDDPHWRPAHYGTA